MIPAGPRLLRRTWTRAMTGVGECGEIRHALGVYILGAISPPDRSTVEHHLARCADCRAELAGLAALPGRLGSVPAADMTRLAGDERGGAGRVNARLTSRCRRCWTGRPGSAGACAGVA